MKNKFIYVLLIFSIGLTFSGRVHAPEPGFETDMSEYEETSLEDLTQEDLEDLANQFEIESEIERRLKLPEMKISTEEMKEWELLRSRLEREEIEEKIEEILGGKKTVFGAVNSNVKVYFEGYPELINIESSRVFDFFKGFLDNWKSMSKNMDYADKISSLREILTRILFFEDQIVEKHGEGLFEEIFSEAGKKYMETLSEGDKFIETLSNFFEDLSAQWENNTRKAWLKIQEGRMIEVAKRSDKFQNNLLQKFSGKVDSGKISGEKTKTYIKDWYKKGIIKEKTFDDLVNKLAEKKELGKKESFQKDMAEFRVPVLRERLENSISFFKKMSDVKKQDFYNDSYVYFRDLVKVRDFDEFTKELDGFVNKRGGFLRRKLLSFEEAQSFLKKLLEDKEFQGELSKKIDSFVKIEAPKETSFSKFFNSLSGRLQSGLKSLVRLNVISEKTLKSVFSFEAFKKFISGTEGGWFLFEADLLIGRKPIFGKSSKGFFSGSDIDSKHVVSYFEEFLDRLPNVLIKYKLYFLKEVAKRLRDSRNDLLQSVFGKRVFINLLESLGKKLKDVMEKVILENEEEERPNYNKKKLKEFKKIFGRFNFDRAAF